MKSEIDKRVTVDCPLSLWERARVRAYGRKQKILFSFFLIAAPLTPALSQRESEYGIAIVTATHSDAQNGDGAKIS